MIGIDNAGFILGDRYKITHLYGMHGPGLYAISKNGVPAKLSCDIGNRLTGKGNCFVYINNIKNYPKDVL
jgi:hypothetical protein